MEKQPIEILLIEDHGIVLCGLKGVLDQQDDFKIIGESSSFHDAIKLASTINPDIIKVGSFLLRKSQFQVQINHLD